MFLVIGAGVNGVGFHFDVFLYLILLFSALQVIRNLLLQLGTFEEFAISEGGELLA